MAATFIALNLMLFVGAAIASYLRHHPGAMLNIVDLKHASKTRRLTTKEITAMQHRLSELTAEMARVAAQREKLYERTAQDIGDWRDHTQRLMSIYHQHNLQARGGGEMPACFRSYPPIDVSLLFSPPDSKKLSWNCKGVLVDGVRPPASGSNRGPDAASSGAKPAGLNPEAGDVGLAGELSARPRVRSN